MTDRRKDKSPRKPITKTGIRGYGLKDGVVIEQNYMSDMVKNQMRVCVPRRWPNGMIQKFADQKFFGTGTGNGRSIGWFIKDYGDKTLNKGLQRVPCTGADCERMLGYHDHVILTMKEKK